MENRTIKIQHKHLIKLVKPVIITDSTDLKIIWKCFGIIFPK